MTSEIDQNVPVRDQVHLESLPGAVERLLQQCHDLGGPALDGIRLTFPDSVVLELDGPLLPLARLRMYSAFSVVLGDHEENRADGYATALAAARRSLATGVLGLLAADGADLAFRVDALPDRPALCDVFAGLGWVNRPRAWQVNIVSRGRLLLAQIGPLHTSRRFPALRRVPASTTPVMAALLVQFLKPRPGAVVLDPFCGAGTLLVEAAATGLDLRLIGGDRSPDSLAAAVLNRDLMPGARLLNADAAALPLRAGAVDRVVANLPFGKRVGSHAANARLYPAFLAELNRVLAADGRAVLLTEDKNVFRESVQHTRDLRLLREVKLTSGGLHPSAFVVERTRGARRRDKAAGSSRGARAGR